MRMSGGSPVRMLRGDAAEAMAKAHHAGFIGFTMRETRLLRRGQDPFGGDKLRKNRRFL